MNTSFRKWHRKTADATGGRDWHDERDAGSVRWDGVTERDLSMNNSGSTPLPGPRAREPRRVGCPSGYGVSDVYKHRYLWQRQYDRPCLRRFQSIRRCAHPYCCCGSAPVFHRPRRRAQPAAATHLCPGHKCSDRPTRNLPVRFRRSAEEGASRGHFRRAIIT
jgi:hypothetical protein